MSAPRPPALSPLAPRGLGREDAAHYIGISASKFDQLVGDGRMPKPIAIDGRRVWDRRALDQAFDRLAGGGGKGAPDANEWDAVA